MKKRVVILLPVLLMCLIFLPGCAEEKPQPRGKYAIFRNACGTEEYEVYRSSTKTVEYEYDEEKEYQFRYNVFYTDDDSFTGESGSGYSTIKANEPGTYEVFAHFEYNGMEAYSILKVIIKEKPLITPEVRFDPNGATVEERDGETIYVYDYDGKEHFPLIELYYEGEQLELDLYSNGIVSVKVHGEEYEYYRPRAIGEYQLEYWVTSSNFKNEEEKSKYDSVMVTITVEIRG